MANKPAKRRGHEFTEAEIDRALIALALNSGNTARAREALEHDTELQRVPSVVTLHQWKHKHADRFNEIRNQHAPAIEAAAVHNWRAIVEEGTRAQLEATRRATAGLEDLTGHEAARVAKDLSIATGVAADKLLVFTDRPNVITQHRDPSELLRAIDAITGTATEIPTDALISESESTNARELGPGADA